MATTVLRPAASRRTLRLAPWRSPADQPGYVRPTLLVITMLAAVLYTWGIEHSQYHTFYATAARSMTESWKAFLYGSFDPGNSITLDKLPGFLWPQAISARVFGFHPWALVLPQVLEGVASLLVLHRVVNRWAGAHAALIADAAFLVTPVAVGLFRTAVEDPAFTLCVLLAAEATQRAAMSGRLRPLVIAGVWVGVGFQAKMLEAWAVLPALALVHLISAPIALRRRLAHLVLSAVAMTAVSASWMLAVTLVPAQDRPYVDGTTNNSAFSMVVGYNFLNRFSSLGITAASTGSVSSTQGGGGGGPQSRAAGATGGAGGVVGGRTGRSDRTDRTAPRGSAGASGPQGVRQARDRAPGRAAGAAPGALGGFRTGGGRGGGQDGWSKMFDASLASQTGWLYPMGAFAGVCGLLWRRGKPRTDGLRAGFVLWGAWLTTYFLVFSAGSVGGHTYYMGVIAVPLAALTGGGVAVLWRAYRAGGPRAWALPGAVAATAAWSAYVAGRFPSFLPWLAPVVGVLGLAAVVLLALARPGRGTSAGGTASVGRLALAGLAVSLVAMLLAPGSWAAQVLSPSYRDSGMGAVGPSGMSRGHGSVMPAGARTGRTAWSGGTQRGRAAGTEGAPGFGGFSAFGGYGGLGGHGVSRGQGGAGASGELTADQRKLLAYTSARRGSATYVFATTNWNGAAPYILSTGAHVLPLGGFSGKVPFPSPEQFRRLVDSGRLTYVLLGGAGRGGGGGGMVGSAGAATTATAHITSWVRSSCRLVPDAVFGAASGSSGHGEADPVEQALYRCGPGR
ncbi:mannosyltransferase [Streptomyces yokosukanensis]|uniref:Mannosyltransferase n=1 Tax=Streptomyces yokosukanensis TaxID=67386 RepID=A0A117PZE0_9ACTN|nr:glycosyltransferase family 39 protein [Streptomyces yokosukanensis]KUM99633.1 mannosyltransferase [Streptomyces yokosukanensis]